MSAGSMAKLQNEFKIVCGENDEMKKKLTDYEVTFNRFNTEKEGNITTLRAECEKLNALGERRNNEIRALGGEVEEAREAVRLSANQNAKMRREMDEANNKLNITS